MTENYIQYDSGYQKEDIDISDVKRAISDIQKMDEEHGAFWVSVITDDENVIEVNKDLSFTVIFDGKEVKSKAENWDEIEALFILLLDDKYDEIEWKIK